MEPTIAGRGDRRGGAIFCKRWKLRRKYFVAPATWDDTSERLQSTRVPVATATAAQALFGRSFKVTQQRGKSLDSELAELVMATIHPSAVLRAENRDEMFAGLVDDLRVVATRQRA